MIKTRLQLKQYFNTGDFPTEAEFSNLIDSFLHAEDGKAIKNIAPMLGGVKILLSDNSVLKIPVQRFLGVGQLEFVSKGKNNGVQNQSEEIAEAGDLYKGQKDDTTYWHLALYMGDIDGGDVENLNNFVPLSVTTIETFVNFNP